MISCTIQYLERVKDGWHIKFTSPNDDFWLLLSNFKLEQKQSKQQSCYWNPRLFGGKGGWFITDSIFLKYQNSFDNYAQKRQEAELEYEAEDLWGTSKKKRNQEKAEKDERQRWGEWAKDQAKQYESQQQQDNDYWDRLHREQGSSSRRSTASSTVKLTFSQAVALLGLDLARIEKTTVQEVKRAFHNRALKYHPDMINQADNQASHMEMVKLNQAYQMVLLHVQQVSSEGVRF